MPVCPVYVSAMPFMCLMCCILMFGFCSADGLTSDLSLRRAGGKRDVNSAFRICKVAKRYNHSSCSWAALTPADEKEDKWYEELVIRTPFHLGSQILIMYSNCLCSPQLFPECHRRNIHNLLDLGSYKQGLCKATNPPTSCPTYRSYSQRRSLFLEEAWRYWGLCFPF